MSKVNIVFTKDHGLHTRKGDEIELHKIQADYFIENGIAVTKEDYEKQSKTKKSEDTKK